jgi:RNA polymerase sigma-70 factor (ECF subfamily)
MSELSEKHSSGAPGPETPNLEALMLKYQQADRRSAEALMTALVPVLGRFFMATLDGRQACDDLVQETLLRIHRARHSYRPSDPLLPWVFAIARHVRVDQYRKRRRRAVREEAVEPEVLESHPASTGSKAGNLPDFETLMGYLPESQQQVVTMLKVLGMSVEEVARATSSSVGSVKQKAHRAYDRLRAILQDQGGTKKAVSERP